MFIVPEATTLCQMALTYLLDLLTNEKADILGHTDIGEWRELYCAALSLELYEVCAQIKTILDMTEEPIELD